MNFYGKAVLDCLLTGPRTLEMMVNETDLSPKHVMSGLLDLRSDGYTISATVGVRTDDGWEPTLYAWEDRPDE